MRIALQNIHKHYGKVKANNGVTLTVEPGTIHGILGENGAGKSTLMKILSGYIQKTSGTIFAEDSPANYQTPAEASRLGIGMLYQDPLDFPLLSVLENFMLGQTGGFLSFLRSGTRTKDFRKTFEHLASHFSFSINPDSLVKHLTVGERQQLEILRLLSIGIKILILDEPTTGISALQKEVLFQALRKLTSEGKSVIMVSHKLEDVETLCDKLTVLRQGEVTGEMEKPFDTAHLLQMMFGVPPVPPTCSGMEPGKNVLILKRVSASGGRAGLRDCDAIICQGEVIGLAGLEGSGQGLFLRVASGVKQPLKGDIYLNDRKMTGKDYHMFKRRQVSFLPGSRLEEGLIPGLTITEHFALLNNEHGFFVKWSEAFQRAVSCIQAFNIKGSPDSSVESLSGGNQQRLLLSFLSENPSLLLLENPTRGLDLESAHWVWQYLQKYCASNTTIVFSSPELDEILMVADRVFVFFEGMVIKDTKTNTTAVDELGRAIAGKTVSENVCSNGTYSSEALSEP